VNDNEKRKHTFYSCLGVWTIKKVRDAMSGKKCGKEKKKNEIFFVWIQKFNIFFMFFDAIGRGANQSL